MEQLFSKYHDIKHQKQKRVTYRGNTLDEAIIFGQAVEIKVSSRSKYITSKIRFSSVPRWMRPSNALN